MTKNEFDIVTDTSTLAIPDKYLFTVKEAASFLGVSKHSVYRRINEDVSLHAVKIAGKSIRIPREEVKKLIKGVQK